MWILLVLAGTALMMIISIPGLFKAAGLKRVEDLIPAPSKVDEWDRIREE
jgi:hypothetical protein